MSAKRMARAAAGYVGRVVTSSEDRVHVPKQPKNERSIVAIGLLTRRDLDILGSGFRRAIPLDGSGDFEDLLARIDEAERKAAERGGG